MLRKIHYHSSKFFKGYYNLLLVCLILLFIFRPNTDNLIYLGIWKFILTTVFLSAIFNCNHHRKVRLIALILAIPAVVLSWINILHEQHLIFVANAAVTFAFMVICTTSIIYDVVIRARVTMETLRGVICAYFMVAFAFAYTYYLIEFLIPGSFHLIKTVSVFAYAEYLSEMLYFSFTTLLTIGYGDITAVNNIGQTASIIEGIIGQFYIAILVARLVSVYSLYPNKKARLTIKD